MKINNPYDTSFGSLINTTKISESLTRYLALVDIKLLSYEYSVEGDSKLIFITGYNDEEKELPIWEHPLVFQDIKQNKIVAVDLRKYVKTDNTQPMNLSDIVRDKGSMDFCVLRALLTLDSINDELGEHRPIYKNIASAMSGFVSTIYSSIVGLDIVEKAHTEVAVGYYCNLAMVDDKDLKEMLDPIKARVLKTPYSLKMNEKTLKATIDNIPHEVTSMESMLEMIRSVLPIEKKPFITESALINAIGNAFYGPGGSETLIMSLEHIPTWMALVYTGLENKSYKRSKLGSILLKDNKRIKSKEVAKHIENYLKDKTL